MAPNDEGISTYSRVSEVPRVSLTRGGDLAVSSALGGTSTRYRTVYGLAAGVEDSVQPYVIKEGDFLVQLAHKFGFDADAVWNDPANADLKSLRPDPNILWPSDVLYIPEPSAPKLFALDTGSTNTFTSSAPTVTLTQRFVGADATTYAGKAFTVKELDQLTGLTTDGQGTATFPVPVTLDTVTITFTDSGETWVLGLGNLNPINTLSGVFQRLQNCGYITEDISYDPDTPTNNVGAIRMGLRALEASQPNAADTPPSTELIDLVVLLLQTHAC